MAPNTTRNAGRQLLVTRNRLKIEKKSSRITFLRHQEANLLLELGQRDMAVSVATSLAESNPDDSRQQAFLGDILARCSRWKVAEQQFILAHSLCVMQDKREKAFSLAAGPLFLLAEARGDYARCLEIAPLDVLRNRGLRLLGEEQSAVCSVPAESPWREIAILEKVINGGNPHVLPGLLADWACGEAEWRWRIVFEGAFLAIQSGLGAKPWRKYMKQTGTIVLDPRYFTDRRDLKKLLAGGFVDR